MATSTNFSGPVVASRGFEGAITLPSSLTADLPVASAANLGQLRVVTDNALGDDEFAVVVSTGSAWVAVSTTALT